MAQPLPQGLGHRVLMANPRKVCAIYQNKRKSDRNDAELLARIARHARNTLKKEHSDMLALIKPSLGVLDAMTEQSRKLDDVPPFPQ